MTQGYCIGGNTITQQLDLTKTYIVPICANIATNLNYMDVFKIEKGVVSYIYDTPSASNTVTVDSSGVMTFSVPSTSGTRSYCIIQLN